MAKQKLYVFTVKGRNNFPYDMLRYDRCYPKSESESVLLSDMIDRDRTITLMSSVKPPTNDRWKSFGWQVIEMSERTI